MRIHLATDHAGFTLKEAVKTALETAGHTVTDHGAYELDGGDDYPDFIHAAAQAVAQDTDARAVIFGGSGQGEAMVANRYAGVRAVVFYGEPAAPEADADGTPLTILQASRAHNDANVLSIGARYVDAAAALSCITEWLATPFSDGERHQRRIKKIEHDAS